ncbi:MAG: tetratricopeptide repeat protein [Tepidisphaeraceae bacterium]
MLEQIYDPAKKLDPASPEPHLASGDLALEKSDFAVAAEAFEAAAKLQPDNADAYIGLAKCYDSDDPKRAAAALEQALKINPNSVEALLVRANDLIDREGYDQAATTLEQVLAINPHDGRAWAYRAVLAHLAGDAGKEEAARNSALSSWKSDPQVDHLIGLKLSQKYRFAEGRAYQQRALSFDADFLPAKAQLSQDLLRLGEEAAGWQLADSVFKADPYSVQAFNLVTLRDHIAGYKTLAGPGVVVRMETREAELYGNSVLALLAQARERLVKKYEVELPDAITVEIFPKQKDFAIRTFGLPGGAGYLGVCFGRVITINSPASRVARPTNWEAVLWHEFCHSVTLTKTKNKMPRWLSEGISVYEETQADPTWGQRMNPAYREIVLNGDATPVSQLSGAFLKATTPMQVQFAYFESAMVVQYIVEQYGLASLRAVLGDLAQSVTINDALARHTVAIDKLDADFSAWFHRQAEQLALAADFSRDGVPTQGSSDAVQAWNREHPNNVWGLLAEGQALLAEQKWQAAIAPLAQAAALYPTNGEADGPYILMAAAYRELKETKSERAMLEKHLTLDADGVNPRLRLLELAATESDWATVARVARQVLAIQPLIAPPYQYLSKAAEKLGDRASAIDAGTALLVLDPIDPSAQHYRLARLLTDAGDYPAAKRHVLQSLEITPRYRDAHRLLLDLVTKTSAATQPATQAVKGDG